MAQRIMSVRSAGDPGTGITPLFSVSSEGSTCIGELYQPATGALNTTILLKIENLNTAQTGDLQKWTSTIGETLYNSSVNYKTQFVGDGSLLTGITGVGGSGSCNLLSPTHLDTVTGSPLAGSLIVGSDATPSLWTKLDLAAAPTDLNKVLTVGTANVLEWKTPTLPGHTILDAGHTDTSGTGTPTSGCLLGTNYVTDAVKWCAIPRGDDGAVLRMVKVGDEYTFGWAPLPPPNLDHELLSHHHTDSEPDLVEQGAMITGQILVGDEVVWAILTAGSEGQYLQMGEHEPMWGTGPGEYADNVFRVHGEDDATKHLAFDVDAINVSNTTITLTIPSTSGTIALTDHTHADIVTTDTDQTITGKKTFTGTDGHGPVFLSGITDYNVDPCFILRDQRTQSPFDLEVYAGMSGSGTSACVLMPGVMLPQIPAGTVNLANQEADIAWTQLTNYVGQLILCCSLVCVDRGAVPYNGAPILLSIKYSNGVITNKEIPTINVFMNQAVGAEDAQTLALYSASGWVSYKTTGWTKGKYNLRIRAIGLGV